MTALRLRSQAISAAAVLVGHARYALVFPRSGLLRLGSTVGSVRIGGRLGNPVPGAVG